MYLIQNLIAPSFIKSYITNFSNSIIMVLAQTGPKVKSLTLYTICWYRDSVIKENTVLWHESKITFCLERLVILVFIKLPQ